mmetsp:Transcript_19002/g.34315  ORF Transcript_19002/g.34315 Transcript_19002/m.34315 type:complete len:681 (+) Transcript_19002:157-2199(+)
MAKARVWEPREAIEEFEETVQAAEKILSQHADGLVAESLKSMLEEDPKAQRVLEQYRLSKVCEWSAGRLEYVFNKENPDKSMIVLSDTATSKAASSSARSEKHAERSAVEHKQQAGYAKNWKNSEQEWSEWTETWPDEWVEQWLQANKWKVTRASKAAIRLLHAQPHSTMTGSKFAQTLFQECPEAREVLEQVRLQNFCQYILDGQVEFKVDDENPSRHYVWLRQPAKKPLRGSRDGYNEEKWQQKHRASASEVEAGAMASYDEYDRKAQRAVHREWVRKVQDEGSNAEVATAADNVEVAVSWEQVSSSKADANEAHVDPGLRRQDEAAAQKLKSMDPKGASWYLTDNGHITLDLSSQSWSDWDVKELLLHKTNWFKEELARRLWRSQGAGMSWYWIGVDFSHNQLTAASVWTLKKFLSKQPLADRLNIKILKLHHCNLQDEGMNAVADLLVRQPRPVHEVHLSHNAATDYGAAIILGAIAMHPQACYPFATRLARSPHEERWRAMRLRMEYNAVSSPKEVLEESERAFKCRAQLKDSDTSKITKESCAMLSYGYFEMQSRRHNGAETWQAMDAVQQAKAKLVSEILPRATAAPPPPPVASSGKALLQLLKDPSRPEVREVGAAPSQPQMIEAEPAHEDQGSLERPPAGGEEAVKALERDFQASVESFLQGGGVDDDEDW